MRQNEYLWSKGLSNAIIPCSSLLSPVHLWNNICSYTTNRTKLHTVPSLSLHLLGSGKSCYLKDRQIGLLLTHYQTTNSRLFQAERVCRRQFKLDENEKKLSKQVENTVGKGEIAHCEQFLLFPQCFQKACFPGASKGVIVWEWVYWSTWKNLRPYRWQNKCDGKNKINFRNLKKVLRTLWEKEEMY